MMAGERLGVLGGTFDPPHLGHLILAEAAASALGLERLLFVPAGEPPHKRGRRISSAADRLAMLERAIAGNARFDISRVDVDRPGPHFSVDMLALLGKAHPGAALYFILGGDSLADLVTWRDPAGVIAAARLVVMRRPNAALDLEALERRIPGMGARIDVVDAPLIGISGSALREQIAQGRSIRYQVPDAVLEYIQAHGLYR